jgi:flavin-dependent dehydrogenase
MTAVPFFDVCIVGGGPAGAAAAVALRRSGIRSVLIDRPRRNEPFTIGENLPPAARPLLQELGVWDCLDADGHIRSPGNESAWGSSHLRSTDFIRDPHGYGWNLDRTRFDILLRETARRCGSLVLEGAATAVGSRDRDRGWDVRLTPSAPSGPPDGGSGPERLRAAWLVDCTGRRRAVAGRLGARRITHDRLLALAARFRQPDEAPDDPDAMTLVESTPQGWWYTARLPARRRIAVYLGDAGDTAMRMARSRSGYLSLLAGTHHVRKRLAARGYAMEAAPRALAADSSRLDRFVGEGWIAAGDAAVAFDPLSSQGILTALYSGLKAGRAVAALFTGDGHALEAYGRSLTSIYAVYLARRTEYYRQERRWSDRPFWRRRHAVPGDRHDRASEPAMAL